MMASHDQALFEIRGLKKHFPVSGKQTVRALDDINLTVYRGETLGLVGESGCGKTTLGRTMIRIYQPTEGIITYEGQDVHAMQGEQAKAFCKQVQMIFQDPYASLDPRMTVGSIIGEGIDIHGLAHGQERADRISRLLQQVGLNQEHANRFPHEFSGGQRQRIGIARALAIEPECVICDEPISALDVSIQSQIVNLLRNLQQELGLTYVFIAHDLSMVKYISDRVAVMYLGNLMEVADSEDIYLKPLHPYTQALLSAIPIPDPRLEAEKKRILLSGDVPSVMSVRQGCAFAGRCQYAFDRCQVEKPLLREVEPRHHVACHLLD